MRTFDEVWPTIEGLNGWLTCAEAMLLWASAAECVGPILEVGCYHGKSTILLASFGRILHCVDPFSGFDSDDPSGDATELAFLRNLRDHGVANYFLHRCRIEDWPRHRVGFAYLDGDHTFEGTIAQIQAAKQCGALTFCIHDFEIPPKTAQARGGLDVVEAVASFSDLSVVEVSGHMAKCQFRSDGEE